jgi:hypothetical protein
MLQIQNAIPDWPTVLTTAVLATAVCFLFISLSVVTWRRRVFQLEQKFKQLSEDVKALQMAEQRRFLRELKATKKLVAAEKLEDTKQEADPTSMAAVGNPRGEIVWG